MEVKPNVDKFFKVINNWTRDNYATWSRRAKKYATEDVVKLFVGGTDNETAAKQLKANDTKKKSLTHIGISKKFPVKKLTDFIS